MLPAFSTLSPIDTVTGLPMAILPPKFAELPLKVVLVTVNPATLLMPPPYDWAELPLIVQLLSVAVPLVFAMLRIAPASDPAELLLNVVLLICSSVAPFIRASLQMPAP